jgi:seryl-tRNA synthetase
VIDIHLIRNDIDSIKTAVSNRGGKIDFNEIQELDISRRENINITENKRKELNDLSRIVGTKKKNGEDAQKEIEQTHEIKTAIAQSNEQLQVIDEKLNNILLSMPNPPNSECPIGKSEDDNKEIRKWGDIPSYDFEVKEHDDLGKELGLMSAEIGVALAKSRFTLLRGPLAKLERALINFMLDHAYNNGYEEILPPLMANSTTMTGTGQLPKFKADLFKIENEDLYLIPTAEVPLTNMFAKTIFKDLKKGSPIYVTAYTPCFRSEAGSYGKDTKGYIRQHQFNKVELVKVCHPEDAVEEHNKLTTNAEELLRALELPYRVVDLCTGDLGFSASRTYDLEVWLPSQNTYREISSCSNFGDFQARRAGIRFKDSETKKNTFAHTINGSALAVGRTVVAIMENYQTKDGDVKIPEVLQPYMNGKVSLKSFLNK